MDRRSMLGLLAALGAASLSRIATAGPRLVVIVNPRNAVPHLGPGEIESIFTTRRLDWPNGKRVAPFNFPAHTATREAFDRAALHLDPDEVARYWIDRRVRGGHPPPRQVPDAETMVRVVAALETAVGYVERSDADDSVRIVAEI